MSCWNKRYNFCFWIHERKISFVKTVSVLSYEWFYWFDEEVGDLKAKRIKTLKSKKNKIKKHYQTASVKVEWIKQLAKADFK